MRILLLLLIGTLIEISIFILVGDGIGLWLTLALIIGTAFLGGFALKYLFPMNLLELLNVSNFAKDVTNPAMQTIATGIGGLLLVIPGFLTDFIGIVLIIPFTRDHLFQALLTLIGHKIHHNEFVSRNSMKEPPIDGIATEVKPEEERVETKKIG